VKKFGCHLNLTEAKFRTENFFGNNTTNNMGTGLSIDGVGLTNDEMLEYKLLPQRQKIRIAQLYDSMLNEKGKSHVDAIQRVKTTVKVEFADHLHCLQSSLKRSV
jgi:hypothetical protein